MATEAVLNRGAGKPRDHSNEHGTTDTGARNVVLRFHCLS
jgi:hypothetical protein